MFSPGFVESARNRLYAAGHRSTTIECSDLRSFTSYRDADLVYLGSVMMYLEDQDCVSVLRNVRERLSPRGIVISRDWCAINLGRAGLSNNAWFSMHRRPRHYVELAAAAGLRVIETAVSASIYSEAMAHGLARRNEQLAGWLRWPLHLPWYLATLAWTRSSVSFVMRPA